MNCQRARDQFSLLLDARLPDAVCAKTRDHLKDCSACHSEWIRYGRVFHGLRASGPLAPRRPFVMPALPPGQFHGESPTRPVLRPTLWTPGARVAAAAVLVLSLSHVLVYQWAKGSGLSSTPPVVGAPSLANTQDAAVVSGDGSRAASPRVRQEFSVPLRSQVGDHVDAAALLVRLLHYLPPQAEHEVVSMIPPILNMLSTQELSTHVEREPAALAGNARRVSQYLREWRQLSDRIQSALDDQESRAPLTARLQQILRTSGAPMMLRELQPRYQPEARGDTWRGGGAPNILTCQLVDDAPTDARSFLTALDDFLQTRYGEAAVAFDQIAESELHSKLANLSRYMGVESSLRSRQFDRALVGLRHMTLAPPRDATLLHMDTVGLLYLVMKEYPQAGVGRSLPPGWSNQAPEGQWPGTLWNGNGVFLLSGGGRTLTLFQGSQIPRAISGN